ncbi:NEL-type E3 ubiquitin ligase domain-containing protein [Pseudomonas sp. GD03746]|uniref:NEL-type E3 ubiquitin ligase domain-containing protein n=1 Tax=Pseudomonas sp. GD03746 TaxID=2975378 RepID=UPI0024471947|nr:NEL-type E3 ubiquitin ligase domain-containing protein [Pseudomonas sp. GD03746]MDH1571727.1 NEL-type E3 ubiquitin ligase domain-containing protein [Pseudomonas sp. GD03746]
MHTPPLSSAQAAIDAFQDAILGKRLPLWLRQAPTEQLPAISKALANSLRSREQVDALLRGIEGIDSFVASKLEEALGERYGLDCNSRSLKFVEGHREPVINSQPVGAHLTEVVYEEKPLLEVVLRNFTAEQARAGGQPPGNRLLVPCQGRATEPTSIELAALCRELDLGERYQRYLDAILKPEGDTRRVESQLVDASRYAMLVDAYKARQEGKLDDSELQWVVAVCTDGKLLRLGGDLVQARQLRLLGCHIQQVVVFDVIDQGVLFDTTRRVLLYVPGDPVAPWSTFESLDKLNRELGRRLRDKTYQRFFSRLVLRRDSQAFFTQVTALFDDLADWAFRDLDPRLHAYPQPLFNSLAQACIRQIKEDAALIAVPVARLDRAVQREHDQRLAAEGWTLLNLASFFVPGLGLALLAVTAWELLGEVYHGFEAWHEGDRQEALDHLTHVATDLAVLATTAVGVGVARRLWARSMRVDAMVPARLDDGTVKLWQQDLAPFQTQAPVAAASPDALGIRRLDGRAWIEMDGHHYRVTEAAGDGQWRLRPVDGHGPMLRHNGAGAWRLWNDQPALWRNTYRMFRRLGEPFSRLDDEGIDLVLLFHGLDGDDVRGLHVYAQAPSPEMLDSVQRAGLDQRIRSLVGCLRSGELVADTAALDHARGLPGARGLSDQALAELVRIQRRTLLQRLYEALQPGDSPGSAALRRIFPGLHARAARALVHAASGVDRRRLLSSGRVALGLAEAARTSLLAIRQARVLEAFYLDTPQNADLARVALGLLRYLPGRQHGVRWRLHEGYLGGPLLTRTEQGLRTFDLLHTNGTFQLLDDQGTAIGEAGELFDVMAPAYTQEQREAMGIGDPFSHNLRVMLGREAVRRRDEMSRLLGAVRPGAVRTPIRLADGRLGYPLGGGGVSGFASRGSALRAALRDLFPWLSDEQIETFAADARRSGHQLERELTDLRNELMALRNTLDTWVAQEQGDAREDRDTLRETLLSSWSRSVGVGELQIEAQQNLHVMFCNFRAGRLPNIPAQVSFRGVTNLSLLHLDLLEVPSSFLLAFPNLRTLDLGGNLLTCLPRPLLQITQLRHLSLPNNRIRLNLAQSATLASCTSLQSLDLSHNPLGRRFTLAGLTELRWLNLRDTQITQFPPGLFDRAQLISVDLRENRIRQIPEHFYQLPVQRRRRIRLSANPLGEAQTLRLQASLRSDIPAMDDEQVLLRLNYAREVWGDAVAPEHRGLILAAWDSLDGEQDTERFFRVLRQLLLSEDFRVDARAMGNRVMAVLQAMAMTPELRENLLSVANDEWGCQDGATWCLSNLELNLLVWQVEHAAPGKSERALLSLGRRLWRQDKVDRFAASWALQHGREQEGSEVGLAFRVGLRERLDLPVQVGGMSFHAISGVLDADLAEAEAAVRGSENPSEIARSMVDREFWQAHLERTHPDRFAAVDLPFRRQLETLLDDEALTEGAKLEQADGIRDAQRAARRGLMLDMTIRAMEVGPEESGIHVR